jgi:hypothetical protein
VASGARKKGPLTISPGLLQIFYSYAEADAEDKRALQSALVSVVRDYGIDEKDRDSIDPGRPVGVETQQMFRDSDIVVLLITSHYMAERWDEDAQVVGALLESARGGSVVVPVLMRPTDLPEPLSNVQLLPRNRQPVTAWPSQDEAFKQIAAGIRNLCEDLERTSGRPHTIGKRRHAG